MLKLGMVLAMLATPALAEDCQSGKSGVLALLDWTAVMKPSLVGDEPVVTINYINETHKNIRMIKAAVWFKDALGETMAGVDLEKDIRLAPDKTKSQTFHVSGSSGFERLTKLEKRDAHGYICVEAVLYEDGTKESFEK
jgi:hypothetical protein